MNIQQRAEALLQDPDFQIATEKAATQLDNEGLPLDLPAVVQLADGEMNIASDGDETLLADIEGRFERYKARTRLEAAGLFYGDKMPTLGEAQDLVRTVSGLPTGGNVEVFVGDHNEIKQWYGQHSGEQMGTMQQWTVEALHRMHAQGMSE